MLEEASKPMAEEIRSSVIPIAKLLIVEGVLKIKDKEDVWDITVPNIGHFSLSNGAIVHNSDACRYLAISLPKLNTGTSPEELDKRYREAMGGQRNEGMPAIFRDDLPDY